MALTNHQYDLIMHQYEQCQLQNKHLLDRRTQKVYQTIPEYKSLEDSISHFSISQAKKMLTADEQNLDSYREELEILLDSKEKLLTNAGFPADYLQPIYTCADCHDTGFINGHKCHCFKKAIINLLYTESNLSQILEKENFNTFSYKYYSPGNTDSITGKSALDSIKHNVKVCKDFVEHFDSHFSNLFFYGNPGVGKTFLSNCIAKELLERAHYVLYMTAPQLFEILSKNRFDRDSVSEAMYDNIMNCELLIIDDLGTELPNGFTASQLFVCINSRILSQKSTLISTNLNLEKLREIYGERIFSRITSEYQLLRFIGDDIRIQKQLTGNR